MTPPSSPCSSRRLTPLLVTILALFAIACESPNRGVPVVIRQPLPDQEALAYNLLDNRGTKIGTATIAILRQGEDLVLSQDYADLDQHTDKGSVTVDRRSMAPRSAHRVIRTMSTNSTADVSYSGDTVSTVANDGIVHSHQAKITSATYDDEEVFFLMRTLEFTQGFTARFDLVVVDASKGTISRALGTARVLGTTEIALGGKNLRAWQVVLNGAGATSTAWYDTDSSRRLLRYLSPRQTSIELANP